jgi:hypothetical protein
MLPSSRPKSLPASGFHFARLAGDPIVRAKLGIVRDAREWCHTNPRRSWRRQRAKSIEFSHERARRRAQRRHPVRSTESHFDQAQCRRTGSAVMPTGCRLFSWVFKEQSQGIAPSSGFKFQMRHEPNAGVCRICFLKPHHSRIVYKCQYNLGPSPRGLKNLQSRGATAERPRALEEMRSTLR